MVLPIRRSVAFSLAWCTAVCLPSLPVLVVFGSESEGPTFSGPEDPEALFTEFEKRFARSYDGAAERSTRQAIFRENFAKLRKLRLASGTELEGSSGASHGGGGGTPLAIYSMLTPFADLTEEEFKTRGHGLLLQQAASEEVVAAATTPMVAVDDAGQGLVEEPPPLPKAFDWRETGAVARVKDQGQCGSCWSFAAVASIEGSHKVKSGGPLLELSEQQLIECDVRQPGGNNGCMGGLPSRAYQDLIDNHTGLEAFADYPYAGYRYNDSCRADPSKERVFVESWLNVSTDEDEIARALMRHGPLSIGINSNQMQFYWGGVARPWDFIGLCDPESLGHGVTLVGFGEDFWGTKYWTIKNSWGPRWGESGYYRLIRGSGACGVNRLVTAAVAAGPKHTTSSGSTDELRAEAEKGEQIAEQLIV